MSQGASIFIGSSSPLFPCKMLDVSDAGARLQLDVPGTLPDEFILVLSRDGRLSRKCRIRWRRRDMVGVRFLT